jgi:hypothetical protein
MRELAEQIIEAIDKADNTVFDEVEELLKNWQETNILN